jgi:hypothetical protein
VSWAAHEERVSFDYAETPAVLFILKLTEFVHIEKRRHSGTDIRKRDEVTRVEGAVVLCNKRKKNTRYLPELLSAS